MAYIKEEFRVAHWVNVLIAAWLLLAPFALGFTHLRNAMWNSLAVGAAMLVVALFGLIRPLQKTGLLWFNFLLALWLLAAPIILGFSHSLLPTLSHIAMGGLGAGLAAGAAIGSRWVQKIQPAKRAAPPGAQRRTSRSQLVFRFDPPAHKFGAAVLMVAEQTPNKLLMPLARTTVD